MFAPVWSFWKATSREEFEERDALLWTGRTATHCPGSSVEGVAQHVPERQVPAGLPLATNFDQGQGKRFWVEGRPGSSRGWSNLSLQGLLPTWRFCAPSGAGPFTAGWDQAAAFDGGTSLRISARGATGQEEVVYRLFAAHAAESTRPAGNGWRTSTCGVGALPAGTTLARVDVLVGPSDHAVVPVDYGVRIGALSVTPQPWPAPVSVQGLTPRAASWTGNLVTLYLLWSYAANAARYYDVWQLHTDGSATWLVRAACNAAWLDGVASAPGDEVVVTIAVQPVDYAGVRQPLDQAATIQLRPGAPG